MGREARVGVTDVLFLLEIIYDTMGDMNKIKGGPAHLDHSGKSN